MLMTQWKVPKVIAYSFCRLSLFGDERNAGMSLIIWVDKFPIKLRFVGASGWQCEKNEPQEIYILQQTRGNKIKTIPFSDLLSVPTFVFFLWDENKLTQKH